jgi:hypothetical protein
LLYDLAAGRGDTVYGLSTNNFLRSVDEGESWSPVVIEGMHGDLSSFTLSDQTLLYGSLLNGAFRSTSTSGVPFDASPNTDSPPELRVTAASGAIIVDYGDVMTDVEQIQLFDLVGRCVGNWSIDATGQAKSVLRVEDLPPGPYLLEVRSATKTVSLLTVLKNDI